MRCCSACAYRIYAGTTVPTGTTSFSLKQYLCNGTFGSRWYFAIYLVSSYFQYCSSIFTLSPAFLCYFKTVAP